MRLRTLFAAALACGILAPAVTYGRTVVTESSVEILEPIQFVGASDVVAPISSRMLDAIASTLQGNPSIRVIEIQAFGADAVHDQWLLGERRARAIVVQLVRRGIDPRRLRASGAARPLPGQGPGPQLLILSRSN